MKKESIELKEKQKVWLETLLSVQPTWLLEMGYGDSEYVRLHHIIERGDYYEWDKKMLNELRGYWLDGYGMRI